jgi:hypothetical protein
MGALTAKLDAIDMAIEQLTGRVAFEEQGLAALLSTLDQLSALQSSLAAIPPNTTTKKSVLKTATTAPTSTPRPTIEIVRVSPSEFDAVPKYLKGRLTLDKLTAWTDLLERVLLEKYSTMSANPARLSGEARTRYYEWRDQETEECRGQPFVTEADLRGLCGGKGPRLDPTGRSIVAILRHCGRIREVRSAGLVRLVLN